jgi:phage baseplate assembly protein W
MTAMARDTGKLLSGLDELRQSIEMIILTPRGTVPLFREFGSGIMEYLDQPGASLLSFKADLIDSIERWEPRVRVVSLTVKRNEENSSFAIELEAETQTGERLRITV